MMDALPYHHADDAHGDGMALWPDEQELQPLPANNPYMDTQLAVGLMSAEPGFTNTLDFQGFNLEGRSSYHGLNTPQDQGHRAYPDANGETGLHDGGGGDDWLNRNGVNEQPDFNTANNVFSPPLFQAESPSPSVGARPSEVDMENSPSTHGRRYTCQPCSFSSNIKRDFKRHQNTRKHQSNATSSTIDLDDTGKHISSPTGWLCPVQNCRFANGDMMFTREDNLWRHIRKVHNTKGEKKA